MQGVGSRKGVPTQVPFDLRTTREAFKALPRHVQKSAVMNITGVVVSGAQKFHKWGPQWADQYCALCQSHDTTQHRVFECPVGDACRTRHPDTVTWLRDQRPEWTHLAMAHQCPAERAVYQGRELPQLDPPPCRDVVCWTFYTDGTCQSPGIPAASRAAWGVIQDVYQSDEDRLNVAAGPGNGTAIPDGLLCAACGLCPGHQSPLRAELCAIWVAMQLVRVQDSDLPVNIHTDCQVAVDFHCWKSLGHLALPEPCMNHDLAQAIWDSWPAGYVAVHKIKAHRDSAMAVSTLDWWGITANHLADRLANTALSTETPAVVALADTVADHKRQERAQLQQALGFLVELALVRKEAIEAHEKANSEPTDPDPGQAELGTGHEPRPIPREIAALRHLGAWLPTTPRIIPFTELTQQQAVCCNVGGRIADLVWQWLHTIQWPDGPSAPHDWGVSWLELLFNFYLCTGQRFPVRIETVQGRKTQIQQYVPFDSNEAVARPLLFRVLEEQISHLTCRSDTILGVAHISSRSGVLPCSPRIRRPTRPATWTADS